MLNCQNVAFDTAKCNVGYWRVNLKIDLAVHTKQTQLGRRRNTVLHLKRSVRPSIALATSQISMPSLVRREYLIA